MDRATLPASVTLWCDLIESGTAAGLEATMTEDVVLHSPLTNAFVFTGKTDVTAVFEAAVRIVGDVKYGTILADGPSTWALIADGVVDGAPMQEVVLLRLDARGLVQDITLFGRPLPSLTAVMRDIAPPLLAHQGRPRLGALAGRGNAPLALVTKVVERLVMPKLAPKADISRP